MTLDELNELPTNNAEAEFRRCCGSTEWARRVAAGRPYATRQDLSDAADGIWSALERADWLEALAAHPRIGEPADSAWSEGEQARARDASSAARDRLTRLNRDYDQRFGYRFVICAQGKTAAEVLESLAARLTNDASRELQVAAEEQRAITHLRLDRLLEA
jgi:OHCU decarboxylase